MDRIYPDTADGAKEALVAMSILTPHQLKEATPDPGGGVWKVKLNILCGRLL